jgi:3-oxoadipate enol-lactonase
MRTSHPAGREENHACRAPLTIPLHVDVDGRGPPLLLLPTFAAGSESWGVAFVSALAERFTVIRPDWPGIGCSPPVSREPPAIAAIAHAALIAAASYTAAPIRLVGWGLGALAALRLAIDRPDRLQRLVLLGGATHGGALLAGAPTVAALCRVSPTASAEEHMLGLLGRLVSPAWRPFAEMFLVQLLPRPAKALAALRGQWAALGDYDLRPRVHEVRLPTLVVAGAVDTVTPPSTAAQLAAALPDARLHTIAGAGHAALWEQPAAVLDELLAFLDGNAIGEAAATPQQRAAMKVREA